jgi:hypothetical protein
MAKVMFLSEATLKQESILQDNVDMKVVTPTIYDVQNYFILPILGTSLYKDISSEIEDGTVSQKYKDLLDLYIQPTMIWYCRMELPLNINYKYFNKAVGVQNADNMNPASMDEIQMLMDRAKNKAEWYAERLTKFLLANQTTYPLYLTQTNVDIDTIFANRTNYTSGMVIGGSDCCRGSYNFQNIPTDKGFLNRGCNDCNS